MLEISAQAKKPGFCDDLGGATEISKETRFLEIYAQAEFLEIIFLALKTIILKLHDITNLIFLRIKQLYGTIPDCEY